jgi:hypothetical protein
LLIVQAGKTNTCEQLLCGVTKQVRARCAFDGSGSIANSDNTARGEYQVAEGGIAWPE